MTSVSRKQLEELALSIKLKTISEEDVKFMDNIIKSRNENELRCFNTTNSKKYFLTVLSSLIKKNYKYFGNYGLNFDDEKTEFNNLKSFIHLERNKIEAFRKDYDSSSNKQELIEKYDDNFNEPLSKTFLRTDISDEKKKEYIQFSFRFFAENENKKFFCDWYRRFLSEKNEKLKELYISALKGLDEKKREELIKKNESYGLPGILFYYDPNYKTDPDNYKPDIITTIEVKVKKGEEERVVGNFFSFTTIYELMIKIMVDFKININFYSFSSIKNEIKLEKNPIKNEIQMENEGKVTYEYFDKQLYEFVKDKKCITLIIKEEKFSYLTGNDWRTEINNMILPRYYELLKNEKKENEEENPVNKKFLSFILRDKMPQLKKFEDSFQPGNITLEDFSNNLKGESFLLNPIVYYDSYYPDLRNVFKESMIRFLTSDDETRKQGLFFKESNKEEKEALRYKAATYYILMSEEKVDNIFFDKDELRKSFSQNDKFIQDIVISELDSAEDKNNLYKSLIGKLSEKKYSEELSVNMKKQIPKIISLIKSLNGFQIVIENQKINYKKLEKEIKELNVIIQNIKKKIEKKSEIYTISENEIIERVKELKGKLEENCKGTVEFDKSKIKDFCEDKKIELEEKRDEINTLVVSPKEAQEIKNLLKSKSENNLRTAENEFNVLKGRIEKINQHKDSFETTLKNKIEALKDIFDNEVPPLKMFPQKEELKKMNENRKYLVVGFYLMYFYYKNEVPGEDTIKSVIKEAKEWKVNGRRSNEPSKIWKTLDEILKKIDSNLKYNTKENVETSFSSLCGDRTITITKRGLLFDVSISLPKEKKKVIITKNLKIGNGKDKIIIDIIKLQK